jgi:hypothetical protein
MGKERRRCAFPIPPGYIFLLSLSKAVRIYERSIRTPIPLSQLQGNLSRCLKLHEEMQSNRLVPTLLHYNTLLKVALREENNGSKAVVEVSLAFEVTHLINVFPMLTEWLRELSQMSTLVQGKGDQIDVLGS